MDNTVSIPFACHDDRKPKHQIVLSATGSLQDAGLWVHGEHKPRMLPTFVIDRDGKITRVYDTKKWSEYPQLGDLNEGIISIALANCGPLKRGNDALFHPIELDSNYMPIADMSKPYVKFFYEYCSQRPHRGFTHYELIYPAQLTSLDGLLSRLIRIHHIRYQYDPLTGDITPNLRHGIPGVYLACGGDRSRTDLHPQIELINLLKNLSK